MSEGQEVHELDLDCRHGGEPPSIEWKHMNGYLRLAGAERNKPWYVLLNIENFVTGVSLALSSVGQWLPNGPTQKGSASTTPAGTRP